MAEKTEKIKLVQGDSRPQIKVVLLDETTGSAINAAGATPRLKFRALGGTQVLFTLMGILLPGLELGPGVIDMTSPYDQPGAGGRTAFMFGAGDLNLPAGPYQGEIEVTFQDGTVQTVFEILKFSLREQF